MSLLSESSTNVSQCNTLVSPRDLYPVVLTTVTLYDLSVNGGAVDTLIRLPLTQIIPANTFSVYVIMDYIQPFVFAGSVQMSIPGAFYQAQNNNFPFDGTGVTLLDQVGKTETPFDAVELTFLGSPCTQGIVMFYIMYIG